MNCQELHQDIQELVEKRQELVKALEDATSSGWGRNKIEGTCNELGQKLDVALEKYLPDFQKQFGDRIGIGDPYIEGEIKGLGDRIFFTPWGDDFAVLDEGLFSVVKDEKSGFRREKLIMPGEYNLGVFPMSGEKIMLPTASDGIRVIEKWRGKYVFHGTIDMAEVGAIHEVVAMSNHEWVIEAYNGVYVLIEDANGRLNINEQIDFARVSPEWDCPECLLPLSDREILISDDSGGTGLFVKNSSGQFDHVMNIFDIGNSDDDIIIDAVPVSDGKWFLCNRMSDEWYFLSRDSDSLQSFKLSDPISETIGVDTRQISYLSRNEFLVENKDGDIFVYVMRSDGGLEKKAKIADGDGRGDENSYIHFMSKTPPLIPLSNDVWLINKHFPSSSRYSRWIAEHGYELERCHILRRKRNGEYGLSEEIEGLDYPVRRVIPLPNGRYLLSDGGERAKKKVNKNGIRAQEVIRWDCVLDILSFHHTFENIEDLKNNIDSIIGEGDE